MECFVCEYKGTSFLFLPFTLLAAQNQCSSIFLHFTFEEMCSFRYPNSLYFAYFLLPLILPNIRLCFPINYSRLLLFLKFPQWIQAIAWLRLHETSSIRITHSCPSSIPSQLLHLYDFALIHSFKAISSIKWDLPLIFLILALIILFPTLDTL